jgi:hypothetical protein
MTPIQQLDDILPVLMAAETCTFGKISKPEMRIDGRADGRDIESDQGRREWESAVLVAAESIVEADMADRQGVRVICG